MDEMKAVDKSIADAYAKTYIALESIEQGSEAERPETRPLRVAVGTGAGLR